jgi:hypothetical protein
MPKFIIPCQWEMTGYYDIEAGTVEEAVRQAEKAVLHDLGDEEYVSGSFKLNHEDILIEAECGKLYPVNRKGQ